MKIVAFIPYWFSYNDINEVKKLGGRYFINYTFEDSDIKRRIYKIITYLNILFDISFSNSNIKYGEK
jgi:NAD+--asparagine ADP-ribosyltransferase